MKLHVNGGKLVIYTACIVTFDVGIVVDLSLWELFQVKQLMLDLLAYPCLCRISRIGILASSGCSGLAVNAQSFNNFLLEVL